jgi:hypothetical protein
VRTYALNARSVALLESLKIWEALPPDARSPVYDMRIEGDEPGPALHFSAYEQALPALAWIVDAGELEAVLAPGGGLCRAHHPHGAGPAGGGRVAGRVRRPRLRQPPGAGACTSTRRPTATAPWPPVS